MHPAHTWALDCHTISDQLDQALAERGFSHDLVTVLRVDKLIEETGEAHEKMLAALGGNPRKPVVGWEEVQSELLDVMITAAGAWMHIEDSRRESLESPGRMADVLVVEFMQRAEFVRQRLTHAISEDPVHSEDAATEHT